MAEQIVWLSFDLGVSGDYPKFYEWLDTQKAKDCVGNVAFIRKYRYTGDIFEHLKDTIGRAINIKPSDRIYAIAKRPDGDDTVGTFLFGNRKAAAWEGLAPQPPVTDEPED